MDDYLERDDIDVVVSVSRPSDGGVDVLRQFHADFRAITEHATDDQEAVLGQMSGWIGWNAADEDLTDAGDAISTDAGCLSYYAEKILTHWLEEGYFPQDVLLLDRVMIVPGHRGHGHLRKMIDALTWLLRFDEEALIVAEPEPQQPDGGPYPDGPERDKALSGLKRSIAKAGFTHWPDSPVWWRHALPEQEDDE